MRHIAQSAGGRPTLARAARPSLVAPGLFVFLFVPVVRNLEDLIPNHVSTQEAAAPPQT
ncbi:MAG: hypothetical protein NTV92_06710 [Candidatus Bipolaricaulota bacterium]|nr:hypothetical protein [Candidatus Bipolaricaulota bacterium]